MRSLICASLVVLASVSASPAFANAEVQTAEVLNNATQAAIAQPGQPVCTKQFCVVNTGTSMLYGERVLRYMQNRVMISNMSSALASMLVVTGPFLVSSTLSSSCKKCDENTAVVTTK